MLERVLSHAVDVAITGKPPTDERLVAEPLTDNVIVCITGPDDPDAANGPLEPGELDKRTWLLQEPGSGTRVLNEQLLAEHGLKPPTLTLGSNGAIKQAARAGLGISLLSRAAVEGERESGRVGEPRLTNPPAMRPWFLLGAASGPARPTVDAFTAFVRTAPSASGQP